MKLEQNRSLCDDTNFHQVKLKESSCIFTICFGFETEKKNSPMLFCSRNFWKKKIFLSSPSQTENTECKPKNTNDFYPPEKCEATKGRKQILNKNTFFWKKKKK